MKLAEKFTFVIGGSDVADPILFTATRGDQGDYTITHNWPDGSAAIPMTEQEDSIRQNIVNGDYIVKEILIGSTQAPQQEPAPYRSGGRYLLQKFTFRVAGGATTYTANLNDGTYEVTYDSMLQGSTPSVFSVDAVKERIDPAVWVDVQKVKAVAPQPEPIPEFKPYVLGDELRVRHVESENEYTLKRDRDDGNFSIYYADGVEKITTIPYYVDEMNEWFKIGSWKLLENVLTEESNTDEVIRIRHKATNEREYDLIRQADGQYRYSDMDHARWTAEQGQRFFDNGTWIRVEPYIDGNLLVSGSIAEDTININDYFADLPVEAEDLDLLPDYGVTLDDLRRFAAETGFVVEVDADFCAVYRPAQVPTKFLAADDAELAAVMLAVRTLDKAVDKG